MNVKTVLILGFFASVLTLAVDANHYAKRMDCKLYVPKSGLAAIPKFDFEIGRDLFDHSYIVKQTPAAPIGAPAQNVTMQNLGSFADQESKKTLLHAPEITIAVDSYQNSQTALLITSSHLYYNCESAKAICASGHYNSTDDRCFFPDSVVPVPEKEF